MFSLNLDFTVTPINHQSKIIEERHYNELINKALDSISMGKIYAEQVPNVKAESTLKPVSKRMARFRKAGLIGCLNDSGVTSTNYKDIVYGSDETDSV